VSTDRTAAELARRRDELEAELAALSAPPERADGISFGKRVGDGTAMAVERYANVAVHDRLRATLAEVIRAQEKLADGSYGRCDSCGQAIGTARLQARPWAVKCVSCA
jgi:RNA polymerase-binding transcription factor DksA